MAGQNCVAIGSDARLGVQLQTLSNDYQKVHQISEKIFVGFSGLGSDAQTLSNKLHFQYELYKLREFREMQPAVFAHLVSFMLYEMRFGPFHCEPILVGL